MAADGTSVRSAALCRNSCKVETLYYISHTRYRVYIHKIRLARERDYPHTYDPPHGLDQPTEGVPWYVAGDENRNLAKSRQHIKIYDKSMTFGHQDSHLKFWSKDVTLYK